MGFKGFQQVEMRSPKRSTFDLSHDKRLSAQMGYLYPILVQECVPSDHFNGSSELLVRLAPLLAPIYDQIQVYVHFFFVPNRLIWGEWEEFITGGQFGPDEDEPPIPPRFLVPDAIAVDSAVFTKSHLSDYLGVPLLADLPNAPDPVDFSTCWLDAMPYAAYQRIWFDYYRDRNFVIDDIFSTVPMPLQSGNLAGVMGDFVAQYMTLRPRCYKHDYFTSALPWAQRGDQVMIPSTINYLNTSRVLISSSGNPATDNTLESVSGDLTGSNPLVDVRLVNLDTVGPLVNDFRTAYALQVWLERNAIAGSRYTDSIQAHFDVRPQDSRLQRAEYIGGGMVPVKISEVVATAWSQNDAAADVPQGNMAGHGVTFGHTNDFSWFCAEHGWIMGIMSIVNPPSYHQGLPRYFKRGMALDYPFPTFAKLGEQEVYDWEIYAASVNWEGLDRSLWPVFGYQSRYAEWKSNKNTNHGDFHDDLLFWSLTFDFGITPVLNENFTQFDPNIENRIFAAPLTDNFWCYLHNRVFAKRPLPYFGTPNTLGFE